MRQCRADQCSAVRQCRAGLRKPDPSASLYPLCCLPASGMGWQGNHLDSSFIRLHVQLPTSNSKLQLLELLRLSSSPIPSPPCKDLTPTTLPEGSMYLLFVRVCTYVHVGGGCYMEHGGLYCLASAPPLSTSPLGSPDLLKLRFPLLHREISQPLASSKSLKDPSSTLLGIPSWAPWSSGETEPLWDSLSGIHGVGGGGSP